MSKSIIQVENLGKKYIIEHQADGEQRYKSLRDTIVKKIKSIGKVNRDKREEFWALRHVSFELKQGEVVGIIGRNGAGKSTLLKLLSRITEPTTGKITLRGRVASLLEVGAGFHQELTGRENIFLNGSVLGMNKIEISKKFDEIVAFAEVERFIDTPTKHYSSGMYMRLAFAVAAHLEPEILIVDEVLAVGDIRFQKKCLGKMGDVASKEGRTVLLVSHNMTAVKQLCQTCIWLRNGQIHEQGYVSDVVNNYLTFEQNRQSNGVFTPADHYHEQPKGLIFDTITLLNGKGDTITTLPFRQKLRVLIGFRIIERVEDIRIGIVIHSLEGCLITAFHQTDDNSCQVNTWEIGEYTVCIESELDLVPGYYSISLFTKPMPGFWNSQDYSWDYVENALFFTVDQDEEHQVLTSGSLVLPVSKWNFMRLK